MEKTNETTQEKPRTGRLAEWAEMAKNEPQLIIHDMRAVLK